jgi:hypothetical protein
VSCVEKKYKKFRNCFLGPRRNKRVNSVRYIITKTVKVYVRHLLLSGWRSERECDEEDIEIERGDKK